MDFKFFSKDLSVELPIRICHQRSLEVLPFVFNEEGVVAPKLPNLEDLDIMYDPSTNFTRNHGITNGIRMVPWLDDIPKEATKAPLKSLKEYVPSISLKEQIQRIPPIAYIPASERNAKLADQSFLLDSAIISPSQTSWENFERRPRPVDPRPTISPIRVSPPIQEDGGIGIGYLLEKAVGLWEYASAPLFPVNPPASYSLSSNKHDQSSTTAQLEIVEDFRRHDTDLLKYGFEDDENEFYVRKEDIRRESLVLTSYGKKKKPIRKSKPLPQPKIPPVLIPSIAKIQIFDGKSFT